MALAGREEVLLPMALVAAVAVEEVAVAAAERHCWQCESVLVLLCCSCSHDEVGAVHAERCACR